MIEPNKDNFYWHDLKTEPPQGDGCVVLFPEISDIGILYTHHIYTSSNPEFARLSAIDRGYTHWFPIPKHPQEEEVEQRIKKMYEHEHSEEQQFYKGFQRASENIIGVLKDLLPDRPNVIRAIKDRFLKEQNNKGDNN